MSAAVSASRSQPPCGKAPIAANAMRSDHKALRVDLGEGHREASLHMNRLKGRRIRLRRPYNCQPDRMPAA